MNLEPGVRPGGEEEAARKKIARKETVKGNGKGVSFGSFQKGRLWSEERTKWILT